jgi:ribosomal protein S18 acetylase RimI-like enzyme
MAPSPPPSAPAAFVDTHLVRGDGGAEPGMAWFRTGAPHEELNGVLFATADRIDDAARALGGLPALWHSWPEDPAHDIEAELLARGFVFVEEEPLMAMLLGAEPDAAKPHTRQEERRVDGDAAVTGLRIRDVRGDGLAEWVGVWTGVQPPDARIASALGRAGDAAHYLLAELDGRPVGCAAAIVAGDAVAVEHVVTAAGHRGRGIGTALTAAVLAEGRRRGAVAAVLTASADGAGIYRRLGFAEQGRVRRFTPPPPSPPPST